MRNIVFIGFKNSGKTTLGKLFAEEEKKTFIDTDRLMEKAYLGLWGKKKSIEEIYQHLLEEKFRQLEFAVVANIAEKTDCVIATGGGTLLFEPNACLLKKNGFFVYLDVARDLIQKRIESSSFLKTLSERELQEIYEERRKIYQKWADCTVVLDEMGIDESFLKIRREVHGKQ